MDMGWNKAAWRGAALSPPAREAGGRPDWHGLRARLTAAQAMRRALDDKRQPIGLAGSFARAAADAVQSYGYGLEAVNPVDSATGKHPAGNDDGGVGASSTGGRGVR